MAVCTAFLEDMGQTVALSEPRNWRSGTFADWDVQVGDRTYRVHRVILGTGGKSSAFFAGAFNEGYDANSTCLTDLLPLPCHPYFEEALDFMYEIEVIPNTNNLCPLLKIGDVLQCEALVHFCVEGMQKLLTIDAAKAWLQASLELALPKVTCSCLEVSIQRDGLSCLEPFDLQTRVDVLSRDHLHVDEDEVAEFVLRSVDGCNDQSLAKQLWHTVRFAGVSDVVLKKLTPSPANYEPMALGLHAKSVGLAEFISADNIGRQRLWPRPLHVRKFEAVQGNGVLSDRNQKVVFDGQGVARSHMARFQRASVMLEPVCSGASPAIGFSKVKTPIRELIGEVPCRNSAFTYAICLHSDNGLFYIYKHGEMQGYALRSCSDGQLLSVFFDKVSGKVTFAVGAGSDQEEISTAIDEGDLDHEFVFTVSACSRGATYALQ